ncbi:unnamed protein product, partial [Rotaria sp. Silwood2]
MPGKGRTQIPLNEVIVFHAGFFE